MAIARARCPGSSCSARPLSSCCSNSGVPGVSAISVVRPSTSSVAAKLPGTGAGSWASFTSSLPMRWPAAMAWATTTTACCGTGSGAGCAEAAGEGWATGRAGWLPSSQARPASTMASPTSSPARILVRFMAGAPGASGWRRCSGMGAALALSCHGAEGPPGQESVRIAHGGGLRRGRAVWCVARGKRSAWASPVQASGWLWRQARAMAAMAM